MYQWVKHLTEKSFSKQLISGITWVPSIRFPTTPDQSASLDQYPRSFWRHFNRISCFWLPTVPVAMVHIPYALQGFPKAPRNHWLMVLVSVVGYRKAPIPKCQNPRFHRIRSIFFKFWHPLSYALLQVPSTKKEKNTRRGVQSRVVASKDVQLWWFVQLTEKSLLTSHTSDQKLHCFRPSQLL